MTLYEKIDEMVRIENRTNPNRISYRIGLYAEGTKAKIRNAEYALSRIRELSSRSDAFTNSTEPDFTISEKLQFHVDSFFAFLYSAFDVISHVVNQKHRLALDEQHVSFNGVKGKLRSRCYIGTNIQITYSKISGKIFFKNLDNYRNCSTHRRQICIITSQDRVTPGYDASVSLSGVKHVLCDNPLSLHPKFTKSREVLSYCSKILGQSKTEIERIIANL